MLMMTVSCKKEPVLDTPDFNLTSQQAAFKAGQAGVFSFTGSAGIISFYSGESGYQYTHGTVDGVNRSIAVKGTSESKQLQFSYTYAVKGVYEAYFVAKNANIYGEKEVVRRITVTVTD